MEDSNVENNIESFENPEYKNDDDALHAEEDSLNEIQKENENENENIALKRKLETTRKISKKLKKERKEKKKKSKHKSKLKLTEDEAAESSDDSDGGSGSDDDDDFDSEDEDEYEIDGFVVADDDVEETGKDDTHSVGSKESDDDIFDKIAIEKKKPGLGRLRKNEDLMIDEDELDMIADNNREYYSSYSKPKTVKIPKPRRVYDNDESDEYSQDDFTDSNANKKKVYDEQTEDDLLRDFIEDDIGDDQDDDYEANRGESSFTTSSRRQSGGVGMPTDEQLHDAMLVFGESFNFEDEEDFDMDADHEPVEMKDKQSKLKQFLSNYERSKLIESFCTEYDEDIKKIDRPERFMNLLTGRTPPDDTEREQESKWISNKLVNKMVQDGLDVPHDIHQIEIDLASSIKTILKFIQIDQVECPFIWTYRRDYLHKMITRDYLWFIYMHDEKWEGIMQRKERAIYEIEALEAAATGAEIFDESNSEEMMESRIAEAEDEKDRLRLSIVDMNAVYVERKESYEVAYANDDDESQIAVYRDSFDEISKELEVVKETLSALENAIESERNSLNSLRKRQSLKSRFKQSMATEALKLFPPDRYRTFVQYSYDEIEIEDVQFFLNLLLSCSENDSSDPNFSKDSEGTRRRLRKSVAMDTYNKAKKIGKMRSLVETFSVSASDFGEGQRLGIKTEPPNPEMDAIAAASDLVDGLVFKSEEGVLRVMRTFIAKELSSEPSVRKNSREVYRNQVLMSTKPTPRGIETITPFHEFYGFHMIQSKPVSSMMIGAARSLYVKLAKMEREGLITIHFEYPKKSNGNGIDLSQFLDDLNFLHYYMPTLSPELDMNPAVRESWDKQRLLVLQECIESHLIPSLETELRRDLLRMSREALVEEVKSNFSKMVSLGPYRDKSVNIKKVLKRLPYRASVYSVAVVYVSGDYGKDQGPLCLAYMNRDGILKSTDFVPASAKSKNRERVRMFLKANRPEVVVVNSSGGNLSRGMYNMIKRSLLNEITVMFQNESKEKREQLNSEYSMYEEELDDIIFEPDVLIVKDDVARIFKLSRRSKKMFPDLQPDVAAAVCLGRYVQEPLAELCSMWGSADAVGTFGVETLFLDIHPLKGELKGLRNTLLRSLEQVLVDSVSDAGVDLNLAISHDHLAPMLGFVCGLGLRKADALRQNIRRQMSAIHFRKELLERKLLGGIVYTNAAGFLKVYDMTGRNNCDPLDNTRIHPECYITYDFTHKICAEAMDLENDPDSHNEIIYLTQKDSKQTLKVKLNEDPDWVALWEKGRPTELPPRTRFINNTEIIDTGELADKLMLLELEDFAASIEESGKGKRFEQFNQIKEEIRFPWMDLRPALMEPTPEEMFYAITGETDYTLHVGLIVSCTITRIMDFRAELVIDGNLRGYVKKENISDQECSDITQIASKGMISSGVIIGIKKDKMLIEISMRESHLSISEAEWISNRKTNEFMNAWWKDSKRLEFDNHFNEKLAVESYKERSKKNNVEEKQDSTEIVPSATASSLKYRRVYHPAFLNCTFAEAEKRLKDRGIGEVIIRPSTKGANYLSITWAFQEGWFKHIEVEEKDKRPGDQGLGRVLIVKDEKEPFSDLDEIIANYIGPMNDYVAQMMAFRAFYNGDVEEVKLLLIQKHKDEPSRVPYMICFDRKYPGYFTLVWYIQESSSKPIKMEYISIRSNGYKLRDQLFTKPSRLVEWFKISTAKANSSSSSSSSSRAVGAVGASEVSAGAGPQQSSANSNQPVPANSNPRKSRFT